MVFKMKEFDEKRRVKLVYTSDPYTRLKPGALGWAWATCRDDASKKLEVEWDSGSTLSLIFGEDQWEYVKGDSN